MSEPLIIKSDYPTTDNLCHDAYSVSVISPAFASPSGELNAILQYFYHYFNFEKQGLNEYASVMESIAIAEMIHLKLLGKTITALGAPPIYCQNPPTAYNFYSTKYVTYSRDFVNMIEDDILIMKGARLILDEKGNVCGVDVEPRKFQYENGYFKATENTE